MVIKPGFHNLIILTEPEHGDKIYQILHQHDSQKNILVLNSLSELLVVSSRYLRSSRIISCFTRVIVPQMILDQIGYGAYNLHPGPLQFPGWAPYSFALYEGVTRFGITLHEMTAEIDNGPIIWSTNSDISEDTVQSELSNIATDECFQFLESVGSIQLCQPELLKRMNVAWMGKKIHNKILKRCVIFLNPFL